MGLELPRLSRDFYDAIFERDCDLIFAYTVLERTKIEAADAILALGYKDLKENAQILPLVGHRAAALYHAKLAPAVIVTGGVAAPFFQGKTEAEVLLDILIEQRVPPQAIIVENNATNTQENIVFSRQKTQGIQSLITVGHAIYGRRILMTLAQNWPEIENSMLSNVWYPRYTAENWFKDPEYFALAISQFERLAPYTAQGFIKEIEIMNNKTKIGTAYEPY